MKTLFRLLLAILTLGISIYFTGPVFAKKPKKIPLFSEQHFTDLLIENYEGFEDGKKIKLPERFRNDLINGKYIIEVDFENKMFEGLGQALTYAYYGDMKPGIVILDDVNKNVNFQKFLKVFDYYNVKVWIVEINRIEGKILNMIEHK